MTEDNKHSLFREKSLKSVASPESMDQYLRVTSPGVWALLAGVIILLAGLVVWGIFGHIDTKVQVAVVSDQNACICYVPKDALQAVVAEKTLVVEDQTLELAPEALEPQVIKEDENVYTMLAGNLSVGDIVYPIKVTSDLKQGVYTGTITTERISPVSLLMN